MSAQRFRQKRKSEYETLKDQMAAIEAENVSLKAKVAELTGMLR